MKKLTTSLASSTRIIRATAHTSWGWRRSTLKIAFHALIRSKLDYAAPAWQPWLSETNLTNLDRLQNHSLRLITGQLVSTPLEALRLEADFQSYSSCSKRLFLKANEKARCSTDNHPKRIALDVDIPQRLQSRSSFCRKAEELSSLLPPDLQHRQNIIHFPSPPWQQSSSHTGRISTSVPGIISRPDDNNIKRQCRLTTIISYQADYVVYTVGSASGGTRNGGAAAVVTRGSPDQPEVVAIIKAKGRTFTAPMRKKRLPWNLHYLGHTPMPTIIHSPFSFVQTVSPCVKPSYHRILERSPFAILSVPSHLQSLSSGSLAIHLFQATISQTKQQKKPPTSLQMHHFPSLYPAPFKLSTKQFVTCLQHTNELLLSINFKAFTETSNRLPTEEMTFTLLAYGLVITLL